MVLQLCSQILKLAALASKLYIGCFTTLFQQGSASVLFLLLINGYVQSGSLEGWHCIWHSNLWFVRPLGPVFVSEACWVLQEFCKPRKERKNNLWWLGLPKMVNLEAIAENQQLSLLVPQHLGCSGKSCLKDTTVFVWSGWMENICSWICILCVHWFRLGDMFGLWQAVYVVLHWLFATFPKITSVLVK